MNAQLLERERGDLPGDYYRDALRSLPNTSPERIQALAQAVIEPERFVWVIVGDLNRLRPALEAEQIEYEVAPPRT
jgi:predicted Zn-dependent peptidase